MGAIKDRFKDQFRLRMFLLEHENVSDFCLSAFQKNRSAVPLFLLRVIICLGCIAILIASAVIMAGNMFYGYWPIFLTHWGLILNTIAAAFGVIVSAKSYLGGPIDAIFGLPWYVKMYWAMTNISTTLAFFITVFYWSVLTDAVEDYAFNITLDVFIHVINTVLMLLLLLSTRQPLRVLHFYQPIMMGLIYVLFSVIYYFAGGLHPWSGNPYIYPPLDWSRPALAIVTVVLSMILITLLHVVCAALTVGRDALSRRYLRDSKYSISVENH